MTNDEITTHLDKSESALGSGNYDVAEHLATEVLVHISTLPQDHQQTKEIVKFHVSARSILGNIARYRGDFYLALEHFDCLLRISEQTSDQETRAKVFGSMGLLYRNLSDYHRSLNYLQQALEIYEKSNDKRGLAGTYHNIGNVYHNLLDNESALGDC